MRREVRAYLGRACPAMVRARVEGHVAGCVACQQWVRHLDDQILEYMGGQLPEEELTRMDAHLDACDACRELMHHLVQGMAQSWDGNERGIASSSTTFTAGNIVHSRYQIRSFVGRGGMGEVYEAFDQLMDRRVALKTVLCTVADRPRASRRIKEEVRNAQRVGHAHVCRINELQEHRDGFGPPLPFFTMEFVDGERLGHRLLGARLALEEVRVIALQLLAGLEAAHERGVLHLDFKSDNVMLRRGGSLPDAVIMDFGLSRVLDSEARVRTSERRQFAGTLAYMSVEQLECRGDVGPATDVYAFGVVLYEMLTGTLPFSGESLSAALLKQLKERPPPPSRRVPGLSPAIDRFVLKCLSNDPQLRYADAGQALAALQAVGPWLRSGAHWSRLWKLALPVAAVAVFAVVLAGRVHDRDRAADAPAAGAPAAQASPAVLPPVVVLTPTLLPAAASGQTQPPEPASPLAPSPLTASPPGSAAAAPLPSTAAAARQKAAPSATPAAVTRRRSASSGAAATPPVTQASTRDAPAALEAPAATELDSGWKPARVPKRLSGPAR